MTLVLALRLRYYGLSCGLLKALEVDSQLAFFVKSEPFVQHCLSIRAIFLVSTVT